MNTGPFAKEISWLTTTCGDDVDAIGVVDVDDGGLTSWAVWSVYSVGVYSECWDPPTRARDDAVTSPYHHLALVSYIDSVAF